MRKVLPKHLLEFEDRMLCWYAVYFILSHPVWQRPIKENNFVKVIGLLFSRTNTQQKTKQKIPKIQNM